MKNKFLIFSLLIISLLFSLLSLAQAEQSSYAFQKSSARLNKVSLNSAENPSVIDLIKSGDKYDPLYKADIQKLSDEEVSQLKEKIEEEKQTEENSWAKVGDNCFTMLCNVAIVYIPLSMCI